MQYSITGDDQVNLQGLDVSDITNDLANGDVATITVPNDLINMALGKNGNAIYALDEEGRRCELELRVLKGTKTDEGCLNKYNSYVSGNFAGLTFLTGTVVKKLGDGSGNVKNWTFKLSGGVIRKAPETKINVNGDVEQSITAYFIQAVIDGLTIG